MRIRGVAGVLACALLLTSCTGTISPSPPPSGSADADAGSCPSGTSSHEGLCLSGDAVSEELAAILRSQFEADELSAVIAGVWQDGEPVLFGALGESMPGVPATPDMHHMLGNLSTPMLTTALLQQVEAGALSLDDRVSTWYPQLLGATPSRSRCCCTTRPATRSSRDRRTSSRLSTLIPSALDGRRDHRYRHRAGPAVPARHRLES